MSNSSPAKECQSLLKITANLNWRRLWREGPTNQTFSTREWVMTVLIAGHHRNLVQLMKESCKLITFQWNRELWAKSMKERARETMVWVRDPQQWSETAPGLLASKINRHKKTRAVKANGHCQTTETPKPMNRDWLENSQAPSHNYHRRRK